MALARRSSSGPPLPSGPGSDVESARGKAGDFGPEQRSDMHVLLERLQPTIHIDDVISVEPDLRCCAYCRRRLHGGRADRRYCDWMCRRLARDEHEAWELACYNDRRCATCGDTLESRRADAHYCSTACRVAAYRARKTNGY